MEVGEQRDREPENRSWTFSILSSLRDLGPPPLARSLSPSNGKEEEGPDLSDTVQW